MLKNIFKNREEYFSYDALNYSYLKSFDKDPSAPRESNINGPGVTFGSAVDCLLFDGNEEFEKQYAYITENKPTASSGTLFDAVIEEVKRGMNPDDVTEDYLVSKVGELGLWTTCKKRDAIIQKFTPEFMLYLTKTLKNIEKTILDEQTYSNVLVASSAINTDTYTSKFFDDYDTEAQLAFSFTIPEYENLEFKAMLDLVCYDHKNKKVIPVDLKTMSDPVGQFKANVIKFSYYIQADLYTRGLREYLNENEMKDYTIEPFHYIVVSSMNVNKPYVYKLNNIKGFVDELNKNSVFKTNNLDEIISKYKTNLKHGFDYPAEIIEKGYIELN